MGRRSVTEEQKIKTLTWAFDKKLHHRWTFNKIVEELKEIADDEGFFTSGISAIQKPFKEWMKLGQPDIAEFVKRKPKDDLVFDSHDEHEEGNKPDERSEGDESDEHTTHDALPSELEGQPINLIDGTLEQRMEEVAKRVLHHMMHEMQEQNRMQGKSLNLFENEERPPEPETMTGIKGRKETRVYKRYTGGIDIVLGKLFEKEMKEKGLSSGKLFDIILWNRYGKPKLSYMVKNGTE